MSAAEDGGAGLHVEPLPANRDRVVRRGRGHDEVGQVPLALGAYPGLVLSPDGRSALANCQLSTTESELLIVDTLTLWEPT